MERAEAGAEERGGLTSGQNEAGPGMESVSPRAVGALSAPKPPPVSDGCRVSPVVALQVVCHYIEKEPVTVAHDKPRRNETITPITLQSLLNNWDALSLMDRGMTAKSHEELGKMLSVASRARGSFSQANRLLLFPSLLPLSRSAKRAGLTDFPRMPVRAAEHEKARRGQGIVCGWAGPQPVRPPASCGSGCGRR